MPITPENPLEFMRRHHMIVTDMLNAGHDLRQKWEQAFTDHLSKRDKIKLKKMGYLWQLFSSGKRECVERNLAEEAFNHVTKNSLYLFFQHNDHGIKIERASQLTAKVLRQREDMYVVDEKFSWTYVKSSEFKVGPFFSRK